MMMCPKMKALMQLLAENGEPEFSEMGDEGLQIKIESSDPEGAEEGLALAKESLGEVQDLTTDISGMDDSSDLMDIIRKKRNMGMEYS